jgi:hypothetical protein
MLQFLQPDTVRHRWCQLEQAVLLPDSQITAARFLVFINATWPG